jgi:hypothetical protein
MAEGTAHTMGSVVREHDKSKGLTRGWRGGVCGTKYCCRGLEGQVRQSLMTGFELSHRRIQNRNMALSLAGLFPESMVSRLEGSECRRPGCYCSQRWWGKNGGRPGSETFGEIWPRSRHCPGLVQ